MKISAELSGELIERLKSHPEIPSIVFGPFEAAVYKVNEKYRMRTVVKCRLSKASREVFSDILKKFSEKSRSASVSIDINPLSV